MLNEKIALFDFCETLVDFQTADRFVEFSLSLQKSHAKSLYSKFLLFLQKKGIIWYLSRQFQFKSLNKRLVLFQLRGLSKDYLNKCAKTYYDSVLKPHFIGRSIEELLKRKQEGYRIVLVSGGYDIYLKYFAADFNINNTDIISTRIKFKKGRCKGIFDGIDCQWDNKVVILNRYFKKEDVYSIAYSDSESDIPLLHWANEGVVIRRQNSFIWDKEGQFKEIVW